MSDRVRTTGCEIIDRQQREFPLLLTDMQVLSIPIQECGDCFVDIASVNNEYIKMLPSPSDIFLDIDHNAGLEHSSLVRALLFTRLEAAVKNFNMIYKNDGGPENSKIVFMVFEGLRSIEDCEKEGPYGTEDLYNLQKVNGGEYFFKTSEDVEKAGFQCEDIDRHIISSQRATGGFVSFRVYDETTSTFLDLGDIDADEAKVYLTFSKTLTHEQRSNRNTLLNACSMAGLVNYPFEWWTFCFGTQYYSYYTKNRIAIYGPIKQNSEIVKTD